MTRRHNRTLAPALALMAALSLIPSPLSLFNAAATAQPTPPQLTRTVNDFANVIDDESERELDGRIRALQQATGDVIVVASVPSLQGFANIDELALRMFENGGRGIGQKGKDNGALIVLAIEEREVRIEVGYDLEEFITDGFAGETIRETMVPAFRSGDYGRGLLTGATRLINRVAERRGVELQNGPRERRPIAAPGAFSAWPLIVLAWIVIMMMSNRRGRRRRRGRWGRGPWSGWNSGVGPFGGGMGGFGGGFGGFGGGGRGGGGGFGGFGGGRSGGGGARGSW